MKKHRNKIMLLVFLIWISLIFGIRQVSADMTVQDSYRSIPSDDWLFFSFYCYEEDKFVVSWHIFTTDNIDVHVLNKYNYDQFADDSTHLTVRTVEDTLDGSIIVDITNEDLYYAVFYSDTGTTIGFQVTVIQKIPDLNTNPIKVSSDPTLIILLEVLIGFIAFSFIGGTIGLIVIRLKKRY